MVLSRGFLTLVTDLFWFSRFVNLRLVLWMSTLSFLLLLFPSSKRVNLSQQPVLDALYVLYLYSDSY